MLREELKLVDDFAAITFDGQQEWTEDDMLDATIRMFVSSFVPIATETARKFRTRLPLKHQMLGGNGKPKIDITKQLVKSFFAVQIAMK